LDEYYGKTGKPSQIICASKKLTFAEEEIFQMLMYPTKEGVMDAIKSIGGPSVVVRAMVMYAFQFTIQFSPHGNYKNSVN